MERDQAQPLLQLGYGGLHLPISRYVHFLLAKSHVTLLSVLFNSKWGRDFVSGTTRWIVFFLQSDSGLLNAVSSLAPTEIMFGLSPLTFKPTTLQSSSLNKTDML